MLKKILIGLGGFIAVLAVAAGIFWIGWLTPPSAEAVCDNLGKIAKQETGVDYPEPLKASCVQSVSTPPKFGRLKWVSRLKCARDAQDIVALKTCDKRMARDMSKIAAAVQ